MSISYVGPMSVSYVGPMSVSYVGPMSISYVGPMSVSYVGPLSYSYQPPTILPQAVTPAPSFRKTWSAPLATSKPTSSTVTTAFPRNTSKNPTIVSSILSGTPTTATAITGDLKSCIPEDISESHFTDIALTWEVDTITPNIDFTVELSQALLIAVAEYFFVCLPGFKTNRGKTLTRQLNSQEHHEITGVNVTSATIATGESCDAEIHGATCHVAHVTLRVYSNTNEASRQGSIEVVDFLRWLIETNSLLATLVEIVDIREYQMETPAGLQPLANENVRSSLPDDEKTSGGSKIAMVAVISSFTVSAMIALMAVIHRRFVSTSADLAALGDFPLSSSGDSYCTADPTLA